MELKGKVIIITGVSKGIGLATAQTLLEQGAVVAGWGRTAPKLNHPDFYFFTTDVQNQQSVEDSFAQTTQKLGSEIAGLINNAGLGIGGNIDEISVEDWMTMFRTNVDGIFYCTRLVVPGMKKQGFGHIVNISSIAGLTGIEGMSGYCGTKYAVRGISQALYKEIRDYGVKVTCIYPGSVKTNFFDNFDSITVSDNMMQPEDIASTILHVLQTQANYHHVDIEVRPLMPKGRKTL